MINEINGSLWDWRLKTRGCETKEPQLQVVSAMGLSLVEETSFREKENALQGPGQENDFVSVVQWSTGLPFMHPGHHEDCGHLVVLLTLLALGQDVLLQNGAVKGSSHISILTEPTRPAGTDVSTGANPRRGRKDRNMIWLHPCNHHAAAGDSHSADRACGTEGAENSPRWLKEGDMRVPWCFQRGPPYSKGIYQSSAMKVR